MSKGEQKNDLNPCRRCGNKNQIIECPHGYWVVWCDVCFNSTPYKYTREEAIERWNRMNAHEKEKA